MALISTIALCAALATAAPAHSPTLGGEFTFANPLVDIRPSTGTINGSYTYAQGKYKHVVILSNDGMHQTDLDHYVAEFPDSTLAWMISNGIEFKNARASNPSDSFPATAALFTGGSPRTTGLYWDDSYSRALYPPGSNCQGPIGTECDFSESIDLNGKQLDGGGGFNTSLLPLRLTEWGSCNPVYPWQYLKANTIFEVARQNGLETAYTDKHLTYSFVNGPSGIGLSQGYFPELSSVAATDAAQNAWDDLHWAALANWVHGDFVNGSSNPAGIPAVFGANFQALTDAQSVNGYQNGNADPTANITAVLRHFDSKLDEFIGMLKSEGIWEETLLLVGSKQGQGPIDPKALTIIDPQVLINATGVTVNFVTSADYALLFLNDSSETYTAKANLLAANKTATGVVDVLAGNEIWQYGWGDPFTDDRAPDLLVKGVGELIWANFDGVLYRTDFKYEDHGGWYADDADVPLLAASGCALSNAGKSYTPQVENRQIAVTALKALGLPLAQLDAYRKEGTPALPFLDY